MSEEDINIGFLLNKVTQLMKSHLARQLQEENLTIAQWGVIRDLHDQEELEQSERRTTSADIADRLHMDRPTLSGIVARLTAKDLLQSSPNPQDRRSFRISLTDEAKATYKRIEPFSQRTLAVALAGVPDERAGELRDILLMIMRNFENDDR